MKIINCCFPCYQDNDFDLKEGDVIKIVNEVKCEVEQ